MSERVFEWLPLGRTKRCLMKSEINEALPFGHLDFRIAGVGKHPVCFAPWMSAKCPCPGLILRIRPSGSARNLISIAWWRRYEPSAKSVRFFSSRRIQDSCGSYAVSGGCTGCAASAGPKRLLASFVRASSAWPRFLRRRSGTTFRIAGSARLKSRAC